MRNNRSILTSSNFEHMKLSVCWIYSKISKDRLRRVGGLFLCLEIFDFDLSFLG